MKSILKLFYSTLLFWFCLLSISLHGQSRSDTINYDIIVNDGVIGELVAVKNMMNDASIEYIVKCNVNYKILFSFRLNFYYQTTFNSDGLYSSSYFIYKMNDDIKEANWVRCTSLECLVYEDDEVSEVFPNTIGLTGVLLYFNEPSPGDEIYSERFCDTYIVEKENNSYIVDFPSGKGTQYFYRNGICTNVVINSLISDVEFKIRN